MAQQLLRPKWDGYPHTNADGTVRFCRHSDGSVLIPSYIFLPTGEEVLSDIYTLFGLTAPSRPAAPDPDVLLDTYNGDYQRRLAIHRDGWIRLGDKLLLSDGSNLVDELTNLISASPLNPPLRDTEAWTSQIYLPTGERITTALLAWTGGAVPPIADVLAPGKGRIDSAIADENEVELVWTMGHDRSGPRKESVIYQDAVEIARLSSPTNQLRVSGLLFDTEYTYTMECLDVEDQISPLSDPVTIMTGPQPLVEAMSGFDHQHGNLSQLDLILNGALAQTPSGRVYRYTTVSLTDVAHNDFIIGNSTGGAFNLTLPASPSNGNRITVVDYADTFATNNVTLLRNGQSIAGVADDYVLDVDGVEIELVFGPTGWNVYDTTTVTGTGSVRKERQRDLGTIAADPSLNLDDGLGDHIKMTASASFAVNSIAATRAGFYTLILLSDDGTARTYTFNNVTGLTSHVTSNTTVTAADILRIYYDDVGATLTYCP
jgi:hypothetical protein